MDFIAKKYTILISQEPITLWIKNNQIQQAKFMDKRIQLQLDLEAIRQIKDQPSKIVNGNNLVSNENFTKSVSQMMSSQLNLAIAKNDKKILSRFARSSLIPEQDKDRFIEAINRPNGLRGVLVRTVNRTNAIFQNMAKKIDKFFDKINGKIANKALDKHLSEYQLNFVNRAPPLSEQDVKQHVDGKLMALAEQFHTKNGMNKRQVHFETTQDKVLLNEFLKEAVEKGYPLKDSKIALYNIENQSRKTAIMHFQIDKNSELQSKIDDLQKKLAVHHQKNETLQDYDVLMRVEYNLDNRYELLLKNQEYQKMDEASKIKTEEKYLFRAEPIQQRAEELQNITELVQAAQPLMETVIDRTPSVDFFNSQTKKEIENLWKDAQVKNRKTAEPTRDFMNISAVKFNGVSEDALNKWAANAKSNSIVDTATIDKFVSASLRNAEELVKVGVMLSPEPGIFKFADTLAKESLY